MISGFLRLLRITAFVGSFQGEKILWNRIKEKNVLFILKKNLINQWFLARIIIISSLKNFWFSTVLTRSFGSKEA